MQGSKRTGHTGWKITVPTPSEEPAAGHVSLDGTEVIPKVNLPVTPRDKEIKTVLAPTIEGAKKNPEDEINPKGSTILPEVRIS